MLLDPSLDADPIVGLWGQLDSLRDPVAGPLESFPVGSRLGSDSGGNGECLQLVVFSRQDLVKALASCAKLNGV
jgi:hypothetical protein